MVASLSPAVAAAAPGEAGEAREAAPVDEPNAEAIFRRGQAKYETADYDGAIELWTEAYALVDPTPDNASIKALIIFNLAQAHLKAYDLDQDAIHLKKSLNLLQSFRSNLELLYGETEQLEEERNNVDALISEIEDKIVLAEPEPEPEPEPPSDPGPADELPSGKPLVISGSVVLGLGVGFAVAGILGALAGASANDISGLMPDDLEGREQQFQSGRVGNGLAGLGFVGTVVFVTTGAALLAVGVKRNKTAPAWKRTSWS